MYEISKVVGTVPADRFQKLAKSDLMQCRYSIEWHRSSLPPPTFVYLLICRFGLLVRYIDERRVCRVCYGGEAEGEGRIDRTSYR